MFPGNGPLGVPFKIKHSGHENVLKYRVVYTTFVLSVAQSAGVRLTQKNVASKIPSKSISRMPMECLEGERKFLPIRIRYIKFSKTNFSLVIF